MWVDAAAARRGASGSAGSICEKGISCTDIGDASSDQRDHGLCIGAAARALMQAQSGSDAGQRATASAGVQRGFSGVRGTGG